MQSRADYRFFHRMRVRWADVDPQGIVFNPHYLTYFDTATSDFWRALGLPYPESFSREGGDLLVKKSSLEYRASARYDDFLDVAIRSKPEGRTSIALAWAIFRNDECLVLGDTIYVFADLATRTKKIVPDALRRVMGDYETGAPMVTVRTGDWHAFGEDARRLRETVFVDELGVPASLEWDANDATAVHAVAFNRVGHALGTGRSIETTDGVVHIGRMAVLRTMRCAGVGRAILRALISQARERGCRRVELHAMRSAAPFYTGEGFVAEGPTFIEVGIPHVAMAREL